MAGRGANATSEAIVVSQTPDVCLTKRGSSVVPVPYSILAKFDSAENTSPNVNFQSNAAFHCASYLPSVTGNEAGNKGGVKSGVNVGIVNPSAKSSSVRINGQWVIRNAHQMEMNCPSVGASGNTIGKVIYVHEDDSTEIDPETGDVLKLKREEYSESSAGSGVYYLD